MVAVTRISMRLRSYMIVHGVLQYFEINSSKIPSIKALSRVDRSLRQPISPLCAKHLTLPSMAARTVPSNRTEKSARPQGQYEGNCDSEGFLMVTLRYSLRRVSPLDSVNSSTHNPKVGGSNPPPATKQVPDYKRLPSQPEGVFLELAHNLLTEFQPRISPLHDPPFCLLRRQRTK